MRKNMLASSSPPAAKRIVVPVSIFVIVFLVRFLIFPSPSGETSFPKNDSPEGGTRTLALRPDPRCEKNSNPLLTVKGYKRTRRKVVFSRLNEPDVLFAFPVTTVPPSSDVPPVPPVPAEAPPLFSLPEPLFTTPPLPPVLPRAWLSPVRPRACVRLPITLPLASLSTSSSTVRPLMSPHPQPTSTSTSVLLTSL